MRAIQLFMIASLFLLIPFRGITEFEVHGKEPGKPNILFILLDDLGKEWVDSYGAENISLPNVRRLAAEGMQFSNFYSMPQCTPSRVTFLTGQYPFHHGWVNHLDVPRWQRGAHFDENKNPSIGRVMKEAGYKTAACGKWQIDDFRLKPDAMQKHGFDEFLMWTGFETGVKESAERYWNPYLHDKNGSRVHEGVFSEDLFCDFLIDFMKRNQDQPMFMYYPMCLPHGPLTTTPHEKNAKGKKRHTAMVRYTDHILGRLMDALEELNLREKTLVFWTTDNGTAGGIKGILNGRIVRGGKTLTTENGINAPFIVSCPGLVPQGVKTDALADLTDMLPTFAELAGVRPEVNEVSDGYSFAPLLLGNATDSPRQWILAMGGDRKCKGLVNEQGMSVNGMPYRDRVIRNKRFKLFIDKNRQPEKLIDLQNDPEEKMNLLDNPAHIQVLKELSSVADKFPETDASPRYQKWSSSLK